MRVRLSSRSTAAPSPLERLFAAARLVSHSHVPVVPHISSPLFTTTAPCFYLHPVQNCGALSRGQTLTAVARRLLVPLRVPVTPMTLRSLISIKALLRIGTNSPVLCICYFTVTVHILQQAKRRRMTAPIGTAVPDRF